MAGPAPHLYLSINRDHGRDGTTTVQMALLNERTQRLLYVDLDAKDLMSIIIKASTALAQLEGHDVR